MSDPGPNLLVGTAALTWLGYQFRRQIPRLAVFEYLLALTCMVIWWVLAWL